VSKPIWKNIHKALRKINANTYLQTPSNLHCNNQCQKLQPPPGFNQLHTPIDGVGWGAHPHRVGEEHSQESEEKDGAGEEEEGRGSKIYLEMRR
jgi:hypothetical protein